MSKPSFPSSGDIAYLINKINTTVGQTPVSGTDIVVTNEGATVNISSALDCAFCITKSSDQTVSSTNSATVIFNTVIVNTNGSLLNNKFIVPKYGLYEFTVSLQVGNTSTTTGVICYLMSDSGEDVELFTQASTPATSGASVKLNHIDFTAMVFLSAGTGVYLKIKNDANNSITIDGGVEPMYSWFQGRLITTSS